MIKQSKCYLCGKRFEYDHRQGVGRDWCDGCADERARIRRKEYNAQYYKNRVYATKEIVCVICGRVKVVRADTDTRTCSRQHAAGWGRVKKEWKSGYDTTNKLTEIANH